MSTYTSDTRVRVSAFVRRQEGDEVTIGDVDRQVYLTVPAEALVILDALSEGKTVREAQEAYRDVYGEIPDIEDFLEALEPAGFVAVAAGDAVEAADEPAGAAAKARGPKWLTEARCRRLCGPAVGLSCLAVLGAAIAMIASSPSIVPGPSSMVFMNDMVPLMLGMTAFGLVTVALHEVAHLIAARAAGVPARIGISHRLWIVVAETDMTGIWMASKRERYRAFLAGSLLDAVSASVLVGLLWAHRHAGLGLSPIEVTVVSACTFIYLARLLWQCFLFVRTDFYFVLATAFNCKNLLADTAGYLRNRLSTWLRRSAPTVDQSHIPSRERRVIRWYSLVYVAGRAFAFVTFLVITRRVLWSYIIGMAPMLVGRRSSYGVEDAVVMAVTSVGWIGAGVVMWVRSLYMKAKRDGLLHYAKRGTPATRLWWSAAVSVSLAGTLLIGGTALAGAARGTGTSSSMSGMSMSGMGNGTTSGKATSSKNSGSAPSRSTSCLNVVGTTVMADGMVRAPAPSTRPTAAQQAAADQLVAAVEKGIAQYANVQTAEADGYQPLSSRQGPMTEYLNRSLVEMGDVLDPSHPSALAFANTAVGPVLIGATFLGSAPCVPGPDVGGPLTEWYAHDNLCVTAGQPAGASATGVCTSGALRTDSYFTLDVWTAPWFPAQYRFKADPPASAYAGIDASVQS